MGKDKRIFIRVTGAQRKQFHEAASKLGTEVSEVCRAALTRMVRRADAKQDEGAE